MADNSNNNPLSNRIMDKSDLQAMLRFAYQNDMMSKPFIKVFKWWNIQNSLAYNEYNYNLTM